jgi:CelD/BcsL family acetyltransferase involved in cellulose biosynthesis
VAVLVDRLRAARWTLIRRDAGTEFLVDMPPSVDAFRATLSRNLRTNIPYKERRMNREGRVRIEFVHAATRPEWDRAIEAMGAVEVQSWVGHAADGHLHFRDERNARFWSDFLAEPAPSRAARAWVLYFNELPASFYFSLDSGERRYFIAGLHTDAVARYSAGYILMQRMLEDAITNGIKVVNLGVGDAGYNSRWGAQGDEQLEDWIALRPGLLGKGLAAAWRLKERLAQASPRARTSATPDGRGASAEED